MLLVLGTLYFVSIEHRAESIEWFILCTLYLVLCVKNVIGQSSLVHCKDVICHWSLSKICHYAKNIEINLSLVDGLPDLTSSPAVPLSTCGEGDSGGEVKQVKHFCQWPLVIVFLTRGVAYKKQMTRQKDGAQANDE